MPLGDILLKAKLLAYKLRNTEFKQWVRNELDGYPNSEDLPAYRIFGVQPTGQLTNGGRWYNNTPLPLSFLPKDFRDSAATYHVLDGVRSLEELARNEVSSMAWPSDLIQLYNYHYRKQSDDGYGFITVSFSVPGNAFAQILATARSRLQDLILEISDLPWDMSRGAAPPKDEVERLVNIRIFNRAEGGSVSTFDQSNQQISGGTQYNAAGNINFQAVQNTVELVGQLEQLKATLRNAGDTRTIEGEIVDEAEFHVSKAITQAKKPDVDKKTLVEHLDQVKALLSTGTEAAKFVPIVVMAIETIHRLLT